MYGIVMPAYNAEKKIFNTLLGNMPHAGDITVVDDCSVDRTCSEVMRFNENYSLDVGLQRMQRNSRKIGALKKGVEELQDEGAEYALLMDDDAMLVASPGQVDDACEKMKGSGYAAAAFRRSPQTMANVVQRLQEMEYCAVDSIKQFLLCAGKQRCIHGVGGLYEIDPFLEAIDLHSRDHDADDHEITCILQENGHKTTYFRDIVVKTEVPGTLSEKILQSRRWERGAMKTNIRKRKYIMDNMTGLNRLSLVHGAEMLNYLTCGAAQAAFGVAANIYSILSGGRKEDALLLPLFPIYTMGVNISSKALALYDVLKDGIEEERIGGFPEPVLAD